MRGDGRFSVPKLAGSSAVGKQAKQIGYKEGETVFELKTESHLVVFGLGQL